MLNILAKNSSIKAAVFFTISLLVLPWAEVSAQLTGDNYPVQSHVYVNGAGTRKVSELFTSSTKLSVDLILKDLTKTTLPVYLEWQLEGIGLGVQIGSTPGFVPSQNITLQKGRINTLKGIDLREYFQPGVVDVAGVSESVVFNGLLPEGFYVIRVRAYEAGTGRIVSNRAETFFSIAYALPPIINLPFAGSEVPVTRPQNVLLQWTPRHTRTPGSSVLYNVTVCPVAEDEEPYAAMNSRGDCFQLPPQTSTTYNLSAADLPLKMGQRYAVQVQAEDLNQSLEFQNEGYSETTWFRYGKQCTAPERLTINEVGPGRVNVNWQVSEQTLGYTLEYRPESETDWTILTTLGTSSNIYDLKPDETYLFRVATTCAVGYDSPFSEEEIYEVYGIDPEDEELDDLIYDVLNPLKKRVSTTDEPETTDDDDTLLTDPKPVKPDDVKVARMAVNEPPVQTLNATVALPTKLADLLDDPTKIPCAGQISTYQNCDVATEVDGPTGTDFLGALNVGDYLTVADYAVVITEKGEGNPLSGKGLARLPFMNDVFVGVEFSGVSAIKDETKPENGGCVNEVPANGFFRVRNMTQAELEAEEQTLINTIRERIDPESTLKTLDELITDYTETGTDIKTKVENGDPITEAEKDKLIKENTLLITGLTGWQDDVNELTDGLEGVEINQIRADIQALLDELEDNKNTIATGGGYPVKEDVREKVNEITAAIKRLLENQEPENPKISNIIAKNITDNSATISWKGDPRFTRYVVTYQKPGEGEVTRIVTNPEVELTGLGASSAYQISIKGYEGEILLDTHPQRLFNTLNDNLPPPINLSVDYLGTGKATIKWDKNTLHKRFVLKYTDQNGTERFAYPTTNELTLTGLGTGNIFDYEVYAIGDEEQKSVIASGQFNSPFICHGFNITSSNNEIIAGETVSLYSAGCGDNKTSWMTGTTYLGATDDGVPLVVSPQNTTIYKATCLFNNPNYSSGDVECIEEIIISVLSKCDRITATAYPQSVTYGEKIMLRMVGCDGDVEWKEDAGKTFDGNNPILTALEGYNFVAKCERSNGEICYSRLNIELDCSEFDLVFGYENPKAIGVDRDILVSTIGCNGGIIWDFFDFPEKNIEFTANSIIFKNAERHKKDLTKIKAICRSSGCELTEDVILPSRRCARLFGPLKLIRNGEIPYSAFLKNYSESDSVIYFISGNRLNPYSDAYEPKETDFDIIDGRLYFKKINPLTEPTIFTVTSKNGKCTQSIGVQPDYSSQTTDPKITLPCTEFKLTATKSVVTRGESLALKATGCTDGVNSGQITWDFDYPADGIVTPLVSESTYTATCTLNGETLESSVKITVNDPKFSIKPDGKKTIVKGDEFTIEATNCTKNTLFPQQGVIEWSTGQTGKSISVKPVGNTTYKANCKINGVQYQDEQRLEVVVTDPVIVYFPYPCDIYINKIRSVIIGQYYEIEVVGDYPTIFNEGSAIQGSLVAPTFAHVRDMSPMLGAWGKHIFRTTVVLSPQNIGSFIYKITNTNGGGTCTKKVVISTIQGNNNEILPIYFSSRGRNPEIRKDCSPYTQGGNELTTGIPYHSNSRIEAFVADRASTNVVAAAHHEGDYYNGRIPENLLLIDKKCQELTGKPEWFSDSDRTKLLNPPSKGSSGYFESLVEKFNSDLVNTYYGRCSYDKGKLYCDTKITIDKRVSSLRLANETVGIQNDEVVGVPANLTASEEIPDNCGFTTTKAAVSVILQDLLCEKLKFLIAESAPDEEYTLLVNKVLASVKNSSAFSGQDITFPEVTPALIATLKSGYCAGVVQDLTSNLPDNTVVVNDVQNGLDEGDLLDEVLNEVEAEKEAQRVIITDNRTQETFDWLDIPTAAIPNARTSTTTDGTVCPNYQFDPTGRRISIPNITNCNISVNGILRGFTLGGKTYVAIYIASSNKFLGYYDLDDFNGKKGADQSVNIPDLATDPVFWIKSIDYLPEADGINRIRQFLAQNRSVLKNPGSYDDVMRLLEQVPESVFQVVEGEGSAYTFRLDELKAFLEKIINGGNLKTNIIAILDDVTKDDEAKRCAVYEYYETLNDPAKQLGLNAKLAIEERKRLIELLSKGPLTVGILPGTCSFEAPGENILIQLIKTTPVNNSTEDVKQLLSFFNQPTANPLLETLISKIDYGTLVNAITYIQKRDDAAIEEYDKLSIALDAEDEDEIEKYIIRIPDLGFARDESDLGKYSYLFDYENGLVKVTPFEHVKDYEIVGPDGVSRITYNKVERDSHYLSPFDLIYVQNDNYISAIEGDLGIATGTAAQVPAITLTYMQQKQLNKDIIQTVNLATVFVGGGLAVNAFRGGAMWFAAFEAAGTIGAAGEFGIESGAITGDFADIVGMYNLCVGVAGLGLVSGQTLPKLGNWAKRIGANITSNTIKRADALRYLERLQQLKNSTRWSNLSATLKNKLTNLEFYIVSKGLTVTQDIVENALLSNSVFLNNVQTVGNLAVLTGFTLLKESDIVNGIIKVIPSETTTMAALSNTASSITLGDNAFGSTNTFTSVPDYEILPSVSRSLEVRIPDTKLSKAPLVDIENPTTWQQVGSNADLGIIQILTETHLVIFLNLSGFGTGLNYVAYAKKRTDEDNCDMCTEAYRKPVCEILEQLHQQGGNGAELKTQIQNKLCKSTLGNVNLTAIAMNLMQKSDEVNSSNTTLIKTFMRELKTNCTGSNVCSNNLTYDDVTTWKYLYRRHDKKAPNARKNRNTLVQFGKLKDNVKTEIVQLTDKSATESTLIEFCLDLKNTDGFTSFLNDPNYLIYANGFLGYRNDSRHNYKPEDYEVLTDEITNLGLSQTLENMIGNWLDHAADVTNRNGYFKKGKQFENWVAIHLSNDQSPTYQSLKAAFVADGWNLDEYSIYRQVYFCINGSTTATCTDEGSYFIADFVFVKEVVDPVNGNYLDVKIADTKLSSGTSFTKNQNDSKKQNKLYIRTAGLPIKGSKIDLFQNPNNFTNSRIIYKIYSGGTTITYGGTTK